MRLIRQYPRLIIFVITLLAFALRVWKLDGQSYWIDEGWTLFFANMSVPELFQWLRTEELHPPLYFPLMQGWVQLAGTAEFSTRFVSLAFSVLTVPLTYRLGKALGDTRLGLVAALLMAVSPYQIWHAQDARNYSMLAAATTMSMWSFVTVWQRGGKRWWLLYILSTIWAINSHYHGLIIIGVQGLFLLITAKRHWRGYLRWAGALLLILLPTLFWISVGPNLLTSAHWLTPVGLLNSYLRNAIAFSVGELVPHPQATFLTLTFLLFYLLGLVYAARRPWRKWQGWEMVAFLLCYTLAPNIAVWIYGQINTPVYLERYLLPMQTGYLLAVSMGILALANGLSTRRKRWVGYAVAAAATFLLLGISGWVLSNHYSNPRYAKPDWRGVIQKIEAFSQPGDAIVMTGDGGEKLFAHYYQGDLPVYYPFNTPVPPPNEAQEILADIAANHQRIWFTAYGAPIDATLEAWLAENSHPAWFSWIGRKQLALYDTEATTRRTESPNAIFTDGSGPQLQLVQVDIPNTPTPAGDLLPLTLTWQTDAPLLADYQLSLRLINNSGDIFTQSDWPPLPGGTSTWPANQPIPDPRALWIPTNTPPGDYALQLVVYNPTNDQSLGQPTNIPNIQVTAAQITPPSETLAIPNFALNNSQLTVHNLQLVGYATPDSIQPGQNMWLWLYWLAQTPPPPNTTLRLTLDDGTETITTEYPLADLTGPAESWQPGQVRRMVVHLPTSPKLTGDTAQIVASLLTSSQTEEFPVGQVELTQRPRQFEPPAPANSTNITFGNPPLLTLIGHTHNSEPGTLNPELTLFWQANAEIPTNYTVFVQLLNPDGQVVAQIDQQPLRGTAPTTTWLPGEFLTDPYTLTLPPDLPPGDYLLIAGLYNPTTGERLQTSTSADFVELGQVTVE